MSGPPVEPAVTAPDAVRGWRFLRVAALVAAGFVVVAALAGAWLLGTTGGARFALGIVRGLAPGELVVGHVGGSLLGPLVLDRVAWRADSLDVAVEHAELEVRWAALPAGRLEVTRLDVRGVRARQGGVPTPPDSVPPARPGDLDLPLAVALRHLVVADVEFAAPGAAPVRVREVSLRATFARGTLRVEDLAIASDALDLALAGAVTTRGNWPLDASMTWLVRAEGVRPLAGSGRVRGSLDTLRVEQRVTSPLRADLSATVLDPIERAAFDARLLVAPFRLREAVADWPDGTLSLDARASRTPASVEVRAEGRATLADAGRFDFGVEAGVRGAVADIRRLSVRSPGRPFELDLSGLLDGSVTPARLRATVAWRALELPGARAGAPSSPSGRLDVEGTLAAYRVSFDARVLDGLDRYAGRWHGEAHGDTTALVIDALDAELLGGNARVSGDVAWSPNVRWRIEAGADGLDPGAAWPGWPGRLSLALSSDGVLEPGPGGTLRPRARATLANLAGTLRGRPVEGRGGFAIAGPELQVDSVRVAWGDARLSASGRALARWDLEASLEVPRLDLVVPEAGGSLRASLSVEGAAGSPRIRADLRADSARFGDTRADSLVLRADLDLAGASRSTFDFEALGIDQAERLADRLTVRGWGTPAAHTLEALALRPGDTLAVRIAGGYAAPRWRGSVDSLEARSTAWGRWALEEPAAAELTASGGSLGPLGVVTGDGRVSLDARARDGAWNVAADFERLPLERLAASLPANFAVRGPVSGRLTASGAATGAVLVDLALVPGPGEVVYPDVAGKPAVAPFDAGSLELRADQEGLRGVAAIAIRGLASLSASVAMPGYRVGGPVERQPLEGRVAVDVPDLSPLSSSVSGVGRVRGSVRAGFEMGGTVSAPSVRGEARLEGGAVQLLEAGLELREMALRLDATGGDSLRLVGSARSGAGVLALDGRLEMPAADSLRGHIRVTGQRVQAMDRADVTLVVSPDLAIAIDGSRVEVTGSVRVPVGSVNAARAAERIVVPVSADVVMEDSTAAVPPAGPRLFAAVRVTLGDSLALDAFGLKARPTGQLLVKEEPGRATTASGELQITGGTYRAYGQDLVIERGRLIFAGGPIENPAVDIRASRTARDGIVAGIEVRGTAQSPQTTIFSEPPLPEEQALAYIVLGRPLDQAGTVEGGMVARAAQSAGLQGGNLIAQKVASRVGIQEAAITTGDGTLDDASLVLGTYLSPRVYVSYGFGLFKSASALLIRYTLSSRWTIEAETAEENSAGILYTFER